MPKLSFRPLFEDPVDSVIGSGGTNYPCPDVETLDGHITKLHERAAETTFPERAAEFRTDIDMLLDRRLWLVSMADCADPRPSAGSS